MFITSKGFVILNLTNHLFDSNIFPGWWPFPGVGGDHEKPTDAFQDPTSTSSIISDGRPRTTDLWGKRGKKLPVLSQEIESDYFLKDFFNRKDCIGFSKVL